MSKKLDRVSFIATSATLSGAAVLGGCSFDKRVLSAHEIKGAERISSEYNRRFCSQYG